MAELYPSSAELNELSDTVGGSGLPHMTTGEEPYYSSKLEKENWLDRVLYATANALRVYKDGALTFGVRAGRFEYAGVEVAYAGAAAQALVDDDTNYVYLTAAGVLTVNQTGFPDAAHVPLAEIVCADGDYSIIDGDITDKRGAALFSAVGQRQLETCRIPLMTCRNANGTVLTQTPGGNNFGIDAGGWGDGSLILKGYDAQSGGSTSYLMFEFAVPPEYVADADVKLVVRARYTGTGTIGDKTLDVEAYELDDDGAAGADICATAIQTLTDTMATYTFTITDADLAPGDKVIILIKATITETGGVNPLHTEIGNVEMQLDRAA